MKKQAYEGKPLPLGLLPASYYYYHAYALVNRQGNEPMTVQEAFAHLKDAPRTDPATLPTGNIVLPVDSVRAQRLVAQAAPDVACELLPVMPLSIQSRQYLDIGGLSVLDLIAGNQWERPIYWAITSPRNAFDNLPEHMVQSGMVHQLLPIAYPQDSTGQRRESGIGNLDRMYQTVMTKFRWCGADRPGTYFDENARGIVSTLRNQIFSPLADGFMARGDKAKAQEVLRKCLSVIREDNVPYETNSVYFARSLYRAGLTKEADHVLQVIVRRSLSTLVWGLSLEPDQFQQLVQHADLQEAYMGLTYPLQLADEFGSTGLKQYEAQITEIARRLGAGQR